MREIISLVCAATLLGACAASEPSAADPIDVGEVTEPTEAAGVQPADTPQDRSVIPTEAEPSGGGSQSPMDPRSSASPSLPAAPAADPSAAERQGGEGPTAPPAETVTILQFAFRPAEVTVSVGEGVRWRNDDKTTHTVTFDEDKDSGAFGHGEIFQMAFEQPGSYRYVCAIHPFMQGAVRVDSG